jgi:hypothetical protein
MKYLLILCKDTKILPTIMPPYLILQRELDYISQRRNMVVGQAQGLRETEKEQKLQKWTGHAWLDDKALKCVTSVR